MFRLELLQGGGLPRADVLSVSLEMKPEGLPEFGRSQRGSRVRHSLYLNNTSMAVEETWLDEKAGVVDPSVLSDLLYQYY